MLKVLAKWSLMDFFLGVWPFNAQDLINNYPFCLPYNSYDVISENLDQPENSQLIHFFILIVCLIDIVGIL